MPNNSSKVQTLTYVKKTVFYNKNKFGLQNSNFNQMGISHIYYIPRIYLCDIYKSNPPFIIVDKL